jgi:hypothetical protein
MLAPFCCQMKGEQVGPLVLEDQELLDVFEGNVAIPGELAQDGEPEQQLTRMCFWLQDRTFSCDPRLRAHCTETRDYFAQGLPCPSANFDKCVAQLVEKIVSGSLIQRIPELLRFDPALPGILLRGITECSRNDRLSE